VSSSQGQNSSKYPRTLIISGEPFGKTSATGSILTNLFKGWPAERIAVIYTADMMPDTSVCARNWRFSLRDQRVAGCLLAIARKKTPSQNASGRAVFSGSDSKLRGILRAFSDLLPYRLNAGFLAWLDDFSPQVIYTQLGNIRITDLAIRISKRNDIPVVPHFMDDWPTTGYSQPGYFIQKAVLLKKMNALLARAGKCLAISEAMAAEYRRRFGKMFVAFMNYPACGIKAGNGGPRETSGRLTLYYIGNVGHGRARLLRDIALAARELKSEGLGIELHIFSGGLSEAREGELLVPGITILEPEFDDSHISEIGDKCDCFVHVDSFEQRYQRYFRLSLSSKIPLYMACGLPILAYGPKGSGSNQYINSAGAGLMVEEENKTAVIAALRELALNAELRSRLGRRGRETADERHNAEKERERFRGVLEEAAVKP